MSGPARCLCWTCQDDRAVTTFERMCIPMVLCEHCGNKRCPHATHHDNPCTRSNEPGQPGSRYA